MDGLSWRTRTDLPSPPLPVWRFRVGRFRGFRWTPLNGMKRIRVVLCLGCLLVAARPGVGVPDLTGPAEVPVPGSAAVPPTQVHAPSPPALRGQNEATAEVGVWIGTNGKVEDLTLIRGAEEWRQAVFDTLRRWRFEPVVWNGKAIPARAVVRAEQRKNRVRTEIRPVPNLPDELHAPDEFGLEPPSLLEDLEIVLPLQDYIESIPLKVVLNYVVEQDGSIGRIEVVDAPSESLLRAALDLVAARRYAPGTIRGTPVSVAYHSDVTISGINERCEVLSGAVDLCDPVYPYARVLAAEEGRAQARFVLAGDGAVASVVLLRASQPDFGAALVAAVSTWRFTPAAAADRPERRIDYDFTAARLTYGARRLAEKLRSGTSIWPGREGLDARPEVEGRPRLVYPFDLYVEGVAGSAMIDIVVDRTGLAYLPRVVSASRPEFGWAAAAFAGGLRFKPLTRKGRPVELHISLPVNFKPPKPAAAGP
jgi:TonB family protein